MPIHGDEILSEYRQADENKRLHLFLNYRDFRERFMEIEIANEQDSLPVKVRCDPMPVTIKNLILHMAVAIMSWFRHNVT